MYFSRLGPMPQSMRIATLGFFVLVYGMIALPVCVGVPVWILQTSWVVSEFVPTAEDGEMARDLEARAADHGVELDVTAVDIAQARRLGQLDLIEEFADERFPAPPAPTPAPRRSTMEGVFHPDEHVQAAPPAAGGSPWLLAAAAAGLLVVAIGGVAGAVASLTMRQRPTDA